MCTMQINERSQLINRKIPQPNLISHPNGLVQNADYNGKISDRDLARIIENYPIYKQAADSTGIPWQLLAAVHYRESGLSTARIAHGGPFQIDPPLYKGEENFVIGAFQAARFLQQKSQNRLSGTTTDEHIIKDALWGYNGRVQSSYNRSPYVMNNFDQSHQNMRIKGSIINSQGERVRVDTMDKRLGAYTFYRELLESFQ